MREVDVTDRLAEELRTCLATRAATRRPPLRFPTRTCKRRGKDNIRNRVIAPALRRANELRERRRLPPIDAHVTPHTLRRTYISIMLSAGADIPYVQAQVGHRDPKLTLQDSTRSCCSGVTAGSSLTRLTRLMRDAVPSMQHANMQIYAAASQWPRKAADRRPIRAQFGPDNWARCPLTMIPTRRPNAAPRPKESPPEARIP